MFTRLKRILLGILVLLAGLFLYHYLPRHDIVRITGTEVKYVDNDGWFSTESAPATGGPIASRDVRFINAVWPDGEVRVYRNEDTDWGFPFYFKFDSGDLSAEAQALQSAADNPLWVVVTHYGWRLEIFGKYPNAIAMRKAASPDEFIVPWFNIFFLAGLALLLAWVGYRLLRFKEETIDPVIDRIDASLDDAAEAVDRRADALAGGASGFWRRLFGRRR
jgi:hypothetical protein